MRTRAGLSAGPRAAGARAALRGGLRAAGTVAALRATGTVAALAALAGASALAVPGNAAPRPPDAAAAKVVAAARDHVGDRYQFGGNGPRRWDCSGLTSALWTTVGRARAMPRTSRDQQAWAWPISAKAARPGDLVFFGDPVTHVGLYLGKGRIVDASSSRGAVVVRAVWTSDVIRYGRVPRRGVSRPAAPKPGKPSPGASAKRTPGRPAPASATPHYGPGPRPIPALGHRARTRTTRQMASFVGHLRHGLGNRWAPHGTGPGYDAAGLVRTAWRSSGFGALPDTPAGIERRARPVALRDLAVGDLIFWGAPAVHVAVYVGNGRMIDASRVLGVVSQRRVFASETVRFARLTPRR